MPRALLLSLLTACLALGACGQATLDEDIAALQSSYDGGDFAAVVANAPAVLKRCEDEGVPDTKAWRVEKLQLQAVARQGKGGEALEHLEELSDSRPDKVDGKLYAQVCQLVTDAGDLDGAIDVLHAGVEKYPDLKPVFDPQIKALAAKAAAEGDSAATDKLKALGYL
jgi:hypothetical protein